MLLNCLTALNPTTHLPSSRSTWPHHLLPLSAAHASPIQYLTRGVSAVMYNVNL